ncbi:MATE family efflux transporter [Spiroplasma endosymbiont of Amphibalanus improvisus]|uniref:MATE family efflux transporter n=1 Tax=Spiroplasma endosymbiont of Amphibalanus improvisus TaxID=3066327 RepID=UPI00313CF8BB
MKDTKQNLDAQDSPQKINNFQNKSKYENLIKASSPWKSMMNICLPSILIMIVAASYNVIDKFLAIDFAADDVSVKFAAALVDPNMTAENLINLSTQFAGNIVQLNFAFTIMIGAGTSILFSIKYGSIDKPGMSKTVNNGFATAFLISIVLGLFMWLMVSPATNYFLLNIQANTNEQTPETTAALNELSYQYASVACLMLPFSFLSNVFVYVYRSEGKIPLVSIILFSSIGTNVIFAVIFIKYCHLMLTGAMLATGLSWVTMTLIGFIYSMISKNTYLKFNLYNLLHIDFKYCKDIISLGLTALVNNLSIVFLSVLLTILLGDLDVSNNNLQVLYGAIAPWTFFLTAPASGIYQGSSVLLGYSYGANRMSRYKELMKIVYIFEIIWFITASLLVLCFGGYMIGIFGDHFTSDPNHRWLIVLNYSTFAFAGISYSLITYMRNIKRPGISTLGSSFRAFIVPFVLSLIGYWVTSATNNQYAFFAIYGLSEFFGLIGVYLLFRKELNLYRNYHHDIDINNPDAFVQFEVVRMNAMIEKLKAKKEKKRLSDEKKKRIDIKIQDCEKIIYTKKLEKAAFVKRALEEQKINTL